MANTLALEPFAKAQPIAQVRAIEQGLPAKMLRSLAADRIVTMSDIARVVAPRRTLDRRLKQNERLTVEESDRLARLFNMLDLADDIFAARADSIAWLRTPKQALDGQVPLDLLRTGAGARLVEQRLLQLKHGFFA